MRWDEKKTSGKLACHEVFFDVPTYGEGRTWARSEADCECRTIVGGQFGESHTAR